MEIDMRDSQQPPTPHDATGKKQIRLHYIIQKYFIPGISIFFSLSPVEEEEEILFQPTST